MILGICEDGNPMFFCPGCKCGHKVWVKSRNEITGATWHWNGSMEKPTFSPSIRVQGVTMPEEDPKTGDFARDENGNLKLGPDGRLLGAKPFVCHSFVTDGKISYCSDSTHELSGKTVELPEW